MLTTISKRIQSRLSRQGVKVALGEIKEQCDRLIPDIDNATETDILNVTEYFMNNATKLAVVDDVATEKTAGEELETTENVDIVNSVDNVVNTASIQDIDSSDLYINEAALNTDQPAPLATTTQSQLITTTADQMGIVLDASEISLIAENINHSSDDFDQDIDAIKSAIMAFVQHKSMVNQSKINQMIHEVREVVTEKNSENSQLLTDGLKNINQDIQEANKQFKSNVQKCLTAFAIPAIKAS
jgi:hypothetical protein